jgi:hypothetical protein
MQNKQWVILNRANVELTKTKLSFFKECSLEEIEKKDYWGYNLTVYPDNTFTKFQLVSRLIVRYKSSNKPVTNFNPVFTINDAKKQIEKLGITEPLVLLKQFKAVFQFENIGKTDAKDLRILIELENPISKEWQNAFCTKESGSLSIGLPIHIPIEYSIPVFREELNAINYRIKISYKDIYDKSHLKKLGVTWNKNNNWSYINNSI